MSFELQSLYNPLLMNRRNCLMTFLGAVALTGHDVRAGARPIELHLDLEVDPLREKEMVDKYRDVFKPAIGTQPGCLDVRMLRLRQTLTGKGPGDLKYRLVISFDSEENRRRWVATDEHQRVWPAISNTLRGSKFSATLYDEL